MERKGLSQEGLKLVACLSMLLDHVGAVLLPEALWLRALGRLAFPIYCFLLVEGVAHTSSRLRYGLRLGLVAVLSELPFDWALGGSWGHQNVLFTLLLGFLAVCAMEKFQGLLGKLMIGLPFAVVAQFLGTDYGGMGVVLCAVFALAQGMPNRRTIELLGLGLVCWQIGGLEILGVLALIPIALYTGEKKTHSRWIQWAFYLFYPVHLAVLAAIAG